MLSRAQWLRVIAEIWTDKTSYEQCEASKTEKGLSDIRVSPPFELAHLTFRSSSAAKGLQYLPIFVRQTR